MYGMYTLHSSCSVGCTHCTAVAVWDVPSALCTAVEQLQNETCSLIVIRNVHRCTVTWSFNSYNLCTVVVKICNACRLRKINSLAVTDPHFQQNATGSLRQVLSVLQSWQVTELNLRHCSLEFTDAPTSRDVSVTTNQVTKQEEANMADAQRGAKLIPAAQKTTLTLTTLR